MMFVSLCPDETMNQELAEHSGTPTNKVISGY
jgi:hypothetical protein